MRGAKSLVCAVLLGRGMATVSAAPPWADEQYASAPNPVTGCAGAMVASPLVI